MSRSGRWIYHGCRLLLGGLFCYAGFIKAQDVLAFAGNVADYRLLPLQWNLVAAAVLPYVELLAGGLLVFNQRVRPAALTLGGLTILFMGALASVLIRGMDIECGCFSPEGGAGPLEALIRDVGLLLLAIVVYRLRGRMEIGEKQKDH